MPMTVSLLGRRDKRGKRLPYQLEAWEGGDFATLDVEGGSLVIHFDSLEELQQFGRSIEAEAEIQICQRAGQVA